MAVIGYWLLVAGSGEGAVGFVLACGSGPAKYDMLQVRPCKLAVAIHGDTTVVLSRTATARYKYCAVAGKYPKSPSLLLWVNFQYAHCSW